MDKEIHGLTLMDYKTIEKTAREQLTQGHIIIVAASLMLDNARKMIKEYPGGLTLEEEEEKEEKARKEAKPEVELTK